MSEIKLVGQSCIEEGPRGHRGHRGHRGPTGPTGPTGPSSGALIGRQVFNDVAASGTYTPTPGTRSAIVRGCGGGGGGGGVLATGAGVAASASGGNSGVAIEIQVIAPPNTFLTGGPVVVGTFGTGGVAPAAGGTGGDSTLLIGGVLLTAPGGLGGFSTGAFPAPSVSPPNFQSAVASGVDYQALDQGSPGFVLALTPNFAIVSGNGGSGDYGIGAVGGTAPTSGAIGRGNGAGGGGACSPPNTVALPGGDGSQGIWIIEEYS